MKLLHENFLMTPPWQRGRVYQQPFTSSLFWPTLTVYKRYMSNATFEYIINRLHIYVLYKLFPMIARDVSNFLP